MLKTRYAHDWRSASFPVSRPLTRSFSLDGVPPPEDSGRGIPLQPSHTVEDAFQRNVLGGGVSRTILLGVSFILKEYEPSLFKGNNEVVGMASPLPGSLCSPHLCSCPLPT